MLTVRYLIFVPQLYPICGKLLERIWRSDAFSLRRCQLRPLRPYTHRARATARAVHRWSSIERFCASRHKAFVGGYLSWRTAENTVLLLANCDVNDCFHRLSFTMITTLMMRCQGTVTVVQGPGVAFGSKDSAQCWVMGRLTTLANSFAPSWFHWAAPPAHLQPLLQR